nr:PRC-barrel domain-containing protein [Desulforadius tongensis]
MTKDKHSLTGCKVVAEKGTVLGTVEEYYINVEDGSLSGFEISGSFISGIMSGRAFLDISLVRTIGKKILVVSNDASENLVKIDGGLWETLKTIKDAGSSLWETTVVKAREVTGTINKRLEQLKNERKKALEHSDQCQCSSCAPSTPSPKENNPQTGPAGDEEKISAAVQNNPQEEQAAADEKKAEKDENHSHQK